MKALKDRRTQILFSIIDSYIFKGEPVGSKSLADDYSFDVSPATIRNDMSSLEKKGLLKKAHTSSGRLPSDKGYRLFVDYILENGLIGASDIEKSDNIRRLLDKRYHNASDIIETATKTLAEMTNLTAVSVSFKKDVSKITNIELMKVTDKVLLLVAIFDNGLIYNDQVFLDYPIASVDLDVINQIMRKDLVGINVSDISSKLESLQGEIYSSYEKLIDIVGKRISNNAKDELDRYVKVEAI